MADVIVKKSPKPFAMIYNQRIIDKRLTDTSFRLLCYIEMQDDMWIFRKNEIKQRFDRGEERYLAAMKILKENNFIKHYPIKDSSGKVKNWIIELIYEVQPAASTTSDCSNHTLGDPVPGSPTVYNNTKRSYRYNTTTNNHNTTNAISIEVYNKNNTIKNKKEYSKEEIEVFDEVTFFINEQAKSIAGVRYQIDKSGLESYTNSNMLDYSKLLAAGKKQGLSRNDFIVILQFILYDDFWKNNIGSISKLLRKNKENIPYRVIMAQKAKQAIQTQRSVVDASEYQ